MQRPDLTPDQLEAYEERAAIMEYDGGLSRVDAEELALARVIRNPVTPVKTIPHSHKNLPVIDF